MMGYGEGGEGRGRRLSDAADISPWRRGASSLERHDVDYVHNTITPLSPPCTPCHHHHHTAITSDLCLLEYNRQIVGF